MNLFINCLKLIEYFFFFLAEVTLFLNFSKYKISDWCNVKFEILYQYKLQHPYPSIPYKATLLMGSNIAHKRKIILV